MTLSAKQREALAFLACVPNDKPRFMPFASGTISSLRKAGAIVRVIDGITKYQLTDLGRELARS